MPENHTLRFGKLLGNLQTLETMLRMYLLIADKKRTRNTTPGIRYWEMNIGDMVSVDAFTNYDQLTILIDKFNEDTHSRSLGVTVDMGVVRIRDLLAHGRKAADSPDARQMKIIKFDKPIGGQVRVADCALMNEAWFEVNTKFVYDQLMNVMLASRHIGAVPK